GEVDVARVDPLVAVDALEIAVRPAVDVVADDDLLARSSELGDGSGRRRPRGEGDPVRTAFEGRDRALEALARRVLRAGVFVSTTRLPDAVLGIGRGLVDGRRNRPGQLVGFGAGANGTRREGELVVAHGRRVAGSWLDGRRAGGQPSSSKTSSSPSMSSIWTPTCVKPRPWMIASEGTLPGETDARKRSTPLASAQSNRAWTTSVATPWRRYPGSTR